MEFTGGKRTVSLCLCTHLSVLWRRQLNLCMHFSYEYMSAISVLPFFAASTVIYCTSLTRMPVEQMVSIRSARPWSPAAFAAATSRLYSARVSSSQQSRNRRR